MKTLAATTALVGTLAGAAMADPAQQRRTEPSNPPVISTIVTDQQETSGGIIVPLLLLVLIGIAVSSGGGGSGHSSSHGDYAFSSDARLKTDIRRVGTSPSGLGIYRFRYTGDPREFEGAMAQEVRMHTPRAVLRDRRGFLKVDYARIDVDMRRIR